MLQALALIRKQHQFSLAILRAGVPHTIEYRVE